MPTRSCRWRGGVAAIVFAAQVVVGHVHRPLGPLEAGLSFLTARACNEQAAGPAVGLVGIVQARWVAQQRRMGKSRGNSVATSNASCELHFRAWSCTSRLRLITQPSLMHPTGSDSVPHCHRQLCLILFRIMRFIFELCHAHVPYAPLRRSSAGRRGGAASQGGP